MESDKETFDSLSKTQERLVAEAADYLKSLGCSPGEEIDCSATKTKGADVCSSSSDGSKPLSSDKLAGPSNPDTPSGDGDGTAVKHKGVRNPNLIPIDEDGGGNNPAREYEYYDDFNHGRNRSSGVYSHFEDGSQFDDDSLVAMAKRMDDTSIISDFTNGSIHRGPSGRMLALPQPISAGMKKLGIGSKTNNSRPKPAPPPRSVVVPCIVNHAPPRPPASNTQQLGQQIHKSSEIEKMAMTKMRRDHSPSSGSPSSSTESLDLKPKHIQQNGHSQENKYNPSLSLSSESTSASGDKKHSIHLEELVAQEMERKAAQNPKEKVRRKSSSRKNTSTSKEKKASRRGSGKKNKKPSASLNLPPAEKNGGRDDGSLPPYLPTDLMSKDGKKKSQRSRSKSKRNKKGSKKKQQALEHESDDESMKGVGFNTRINGNPKVMENVPKEVTERSDSMQGIGFNTRIHDTPKFDNMPREQIVEQQTPNKSQVRSPKKPHKPPKATANQGQNEQVVDSSEKAESGTEESDNDKFEIFYESTDESESECSGKDSNSVYDSDDQTQIFYESTDDEFDSEEEELAAVGKSVAQAVEEINSRTAVAKVKNLFGMRG